VLVFYVSEVLSPIQLQESYTNQNVLRIP